MTTTLVPAAAQRATGTGWLPRLVPGILRLHRTALLAVAVIYLAFIATAFTVVHQVGHPRSSILAGQVFSGTLYSVSTYAIYIPVLVSVFIGVPLFARSLETGTFRFAWTQSVGRRRIVVTTLAIFVLELTVLSIPLGVILSRLWFDLSPQFALNVWIDHVFFTNPWMMAFSSVIGFLTGALIGIAIRQVLTGLVTTTAVMVIVYVWLTWTSLFQETLVVIARRVPITFSGPSFSNDNFRSAFDFSFINFFYTDRSGHVISQNQFYSQIYPKLTRTQVRSFDNNSVAELHRLGLTEWQGALFHPQFHELLMTWIGSGTMTVVVLLVAIFAVLGGNDRLLRHRRMR